MVCDTNEFIETLWPKYAAVHAAAVAALRNDAAPGAYKLRPRPPDPPALARVVCHPDASCDPRALPVPPSREDTSSTTSKS